LVISGFQPNENLFDKGGCSVFADGKSEVPFRAKARGPSFNNLSVLPEIGKGVMIADLIAIIGSLDFVLGEVDR
jgi:NADH-quinone oxidoreductase subunit D